MASEIEATVLSALEVLYQKHLQPEQQQAADAYLRGFQLTPEAFGVCVDLLDRFLPQCRALVTNAAQQQQQAQIVPILFFASQTLANKLRRQHAFPERSAWSHLTWSQKIIAWLAVPPSSEAAIPKLVQTQLVLALVACMPRIASRELQAHLAVPGNRKSLLAGNSASEGVISFVLNELKHANVAPAALTELLVVVVEEVSEIQERAARDQLRAEIDQWAVAVLDQILPQIMQEAMQNSDARHHADAVATQQMVLRAVKNWLRYASVSPVVAVNNPLLQSFVTFLGHDDLFDVTVDLVVELVRSYYDVERDLVLIQWLVPQLMQLKDAFQSAAKDEDTDKCLGLCRIFTEMSESYITLLVGDLEMGQAAVVDLLLDCMSYPDVEIADVTIPFWFRFIEELLRMEKREREMKLATLAPNLIRLASICMQHIQFQDEFPRLPLDKQQDFKAFRHELGDILRDFCELLGVESILQHCVQGLEQIFQMPAEQRRWEAIEAHLFCFRSIARHVESSRPEVVNTSIQLIFQHLPQFSEHPAICYTSCLIVSRYVEWLKKHPAFLPQQLAFLNQNVMSSTQDPRFAEWEVARAASAAIRSIATDCWASLGNEITAFYLHIEKHEILVVDDQTYILEGMLAGVRSTRDLTAILGILEQILEPIGARLSALFAVAAANGSGTVSSSVASNEMSRLICIYDNLDVDMHKMGGSGAQEQQQHPLMTLTEKVWPLFNQILTLFPGKDDLVERVCRCYKRILRSCGSAFKPFLPQMIDNLLSFYQREPKSSYLYAGNMVVKYFASDESDEMVELFAKLLRAFAETTFPIFQAHASMQSHPDVIEEFFFLMQRSVKCVPQVLVAPWSPSNNTPLLDSVFACAVLSLEISHNDANKAALCFLEDTLVQGLQAGTPSAKLASFDTVLSQSFFGGEPCGGQRLVNQLLSGVVLGSVPVSRVEADYGSVAGVLVQFAKLNGQKLQEWMAAWFLDVMAVRAQSSVAVVGFLTPDEALEFQRDLFSSPSERTFRRVVRHFGKLCASRNTTAFKGDE
ncbi:hypothetical protein Gpo141_00007348 [Globisporangium polare]